MARGIDPQRIKQLVVGPKPGVHRQQLDAAQPQCLVAVGKLLVPAILGRIDGEKTQQPVGVGCDILGHVLVVDPQSAQPCLTAKDNGSRFLRRILAIGFKLDRQVHFAARLGTPGLGHEIVAEMLRKAPGVAMHVNDHTRAPNPGRNAARNRIPGNASPQKLREEGPPGNQPHGAKYTPARGGVEPARRGVPGRSI